MGEAHNNNRHPQPRTKIRPLIPAPVNPHITTPTTTQGLLCNNNVRESPLRTICGYDCPPSSRGRHSRPREEGGRDVGVGFLVPG